MTLNIENAIRSAYSTKDYIENESNLMGNWFLDGSVHRDFIELLEGTHDEVLERTYIYIYMRDGVYNGLSGQVQGKSLLLRLYGIDIYLVTNCSVNAHFLTHKTFVFFVLSFFRVFFL